jgi:GTP-binding protein
MIAVSIPDDAMNTEGGSMRITSADFIMGAASLDQLPREGLPEIALAGRSNVGKSSLLNKLTGRKSLARISQTPGKTRELNLYRLNERLIVVDLPGYGFAKVPVKVKEAWGRLIEAYLHEREELTGLVHLVDIRHAPSKEDVQMHEWIRHFGLSSLIAATKADKIPRGRRQAAVSTIRKALEPDAATPIVPFSAVAGDGVKEVLAWMWETAGSRAR